MSSSATTGSNTSSTFEDIKNKILAYIEETMAAKKQDEKTKTDTDTDTNKTSSGDKDSTKEKKNDDPMAIILEKVTSFVNKQQGDTTKPAANTTGTGESSSNTTSGSTSGGGDDLQSKVMAFVQSMSAPAKKDTNSSGSTSGTETKSSPMEDIMAFIQGYLKKSDEKKN